MISWVRERTTLANKSPYARINAVFVVVIAHHACPRSSPFIEFFNGLSPEFAFIGQVFDEPHYRVVILYCAVNAPVHKRVVGIGQGALFNPIPDFKFFNIGMVGKDPVRQRMEISLRPDVDPGKELFDFPVQPAPVVRTHDLFVSSRSQFVDKFIGREIKLSQWIYVIFYKLSGSLHSCKRRLAARIEIDSMTVGHRFAFRNFIGETGIPFPVLLADGNGPGHFRDTSIHGYGYPIGRFEAVGQLENPFFGDGEAGTGLGIFLGEEMAERLKTWRHNIFVPVSPFREKHLIGPVNSKNNILQNLGGWYFVLWKLFLYPWYLSFLAVKIYLTPALPVSPLLNRRIPQVFAKIGNLPEFFLGFVRRVNLNFLSQNHGALFVSRCIA